MNEEEPRGGYVDVPYGIPQMPRSDRADLIDKIKPEQIVVLVRHMLMGEELVDGEWKKIPALKNMALTDEGAWELSNLMFGTGSTNISMSKWEDDEIRHRVEEISSTAIELCLANRIRYGITNASQLNYINQIVMTNCWAVLKHAFQTLLMSTIQESRLVQSQPKQPGRIKRILQGFVG